MTMFTWQTDNVLWAIYNTNNGAESEKHHGLTDIKVKRLPNIRIDAENINRLIVLPSCVQTQCEVI